MQLESLTVSLVLVTQHLFLSFLSFLNVCILQSNGSVGVLPVKVLLAVWCFLYHGWVGPHLYCCCPARTSAVIQPEKNTVKMGKCEHEKQTIHTNEQSFWCKWNRDSSAAIAQWMLSQDKSGRKCAASENSFLLLDKSDCCPSFERVAGVGCCLSPVFYLPGRRWPERFS